MRYEGKREGLQPVAAAVEGGGRAVSDSAAEFNVCPAAWSRMTADFQKHRHPSPPPSALISLKHTLLSAPLLRLTPFSCLDAQARSPRATLG